MLLPACLFLLTIFDVTGLRFQFHSAVGEYLYTAVVVCIDSSSAVIAGRTQLLPSFSTHMYAEALAAQLASTVAAELKQAVAVLEGDSCGVVAAPKKEEQDADWIIYNTISKSIYLLSSISTSTARKMTRLENSKAHYVTQWAMTTGFSDHSHKWVRSLYDTIWTYGGFDPP